VKDAVVTFEKENGGRTLEGWEAGGVNEVPTKHKTMSVFKRVILDKLARGHRPSVRNIKGPAGKKKVTFNLAITPFP